LQSAIAHAKAVQLPKERLEEAIEKGTATYRKGGSVDVDLESLRFDAMMRIVTVDETKEESVAQVACIITALSDNRNRTTQQVRHLVTKTGGELLPTDNLNYLFHQVGVILVEQQPSQHGSPISDAIDGFEEALMDVALEAGAINMEELPPDVDEDGEDEMQTPNLEHAKTYVVTTEERDLWQVVQALQKSGYQASQFQHRYVLQDDEHGGVVLSKDAWQQLADFIDKVEDLEDVNHVFHNAN
jgi:transcriptional/translational regulatory protein YebC/TACO1